MALKCRRNTFRAGAGGGAENASLPVAAALALAAFVPQLVRSLQQAAIFIAQGCPGNCPIPLIEGPAITNPRFSVRFNRRRRTWVVGIVVTVTAAVTCVRARGRGRKPAPKK